ncbi:hypothetical protein HYALB_00000409 [Hymenoscyphus albidus]|uniref:MAPEG family protein n=1 Tax=Hymenoscyphus albidus TaxID=595503 RepID=A0A9N9LNQ4_9HELO|nr:hypothetical protein HYALB_00000409 [Hymenoscyphus albidus]
MTTITIDPNYGYVLLAATSTFFLNFVHSGATGTARKAAKVPYPAAYAPSSRKDHEAHVFNCTQRAHANYIENLVPMLGSLFIAGLRFPLLGLMGLAGYAGLGMVMGW